MIVQSKFEITQNNCFSLLKVLFSFLFILYSSDLNSEAAEEIFFFHRHNLETCFSKADEYNKEIAIAKRDIATAKAGIKISSAFPNPNFQFEGGFGPTFTTLYTGQAQIISLVQKIQTARKRAKQKELALANFNFMVDQVSALRFDTHNQVRKVYAQMAAAKAYKNVLESQKNAALALRNIVKNKYDRGKETSANLQLCELLVSQFESLNSQSKLKLRQASIELSLLIGEEPKPAILLDVDVPAIFRLSNESSELIPTLGKNLPDLRDLLDTAFKYRRDFIVSKKQVILSEKSVTLARAQQIPDLYFGTGFTYGTWSKHQPGFMDRQPSWLANSVFVSLDMELPTFYHYQGETAQTEALRRQNILKVELLKKQIVADIVTAYNALKVAKRNVQIYQDVILPDSARAIELARQAYVQDRSELNTIILVHNQYQEFLLHYYDAVVDYLNSWAALEKALGLELKFS